MNKLIGIGEKHGHNLSPLNKFLLVALFKTLTLSLTGPLELNIDILLFESIS